mgnify:FL=1
MKKGEALKSPRINLTCLHRAAVRQDQGRMAGDEDAASSDGVRLGDGDLNRMGSDRKRVSAQIPLK